jgi:hypothetical protein
MSTQDGYLSFWDVDTVHQRVEYDQRHHYDTAMSGLCYSKYIDVLFSWSHDKGDFFLYGWDYGTKVRLRFCKPRSRALNPPCHGVCVAPGRSSSTRSRATATPSRTPSRSSAWAYW